MFTLFSLPLPYYLLLYQFNRMLVWKALDIKPIPHNLDHCAAISVHEVSNVQGPLFSNAL